MLRICCPNLSVVGMIGRGKLRTRADGYLEEEILTGCVIGFQAFGAIRVIGRMWAFEGV